MNILAIQPNTLQKILPAGTIIQIPKYHASAHITILVGTDKLPTNTTFGQKGDLSMKNTLTAKSSMM